MEIHYEAKRKIKLEPGRKQDELEGKKDKNELAGNLKRKMKKIYSEIDEFGQTKGEFLRSFQQ